MTWARPVHGPGHTPLRHLGASVAARDPVAITECLDFEKLRANAKQQLHLKSDTTNNPIAALAKGIVSGESDSLVDSLVTPAGLEKLLAGERLFSSLVRSADDSQPKVPEALANASTSFKSLSEFSALIEPKPGMKVELVLEREWLEWKVVAVKLPE